MNEINSPLILPGSFEFDEALAMTLPFDWQDYANRNSGDYGFVVDSQTGLLRVTDSKGICEYVEGGEYDERLEAIGEDLEFELEED